MIPLRAALIAVCLAANAHARDVLEPAPVTLPEPRVIRIPATVAVFYSDEYARKPVADRRIETLSHRPGAASVALLDRVLEAAFENVLRLASWPTSAPPEAALVFVPRIAGIATIRDAASTARLIELRIEAYAPGGERIDAWTIHAKSRVEGAADRDERLYAHALRDAAAQLLTTITSRPALRAKLPPVPIVQPAAATRAGAAGSAVRLAVASPLEPAERAGDAACVAAALALSGADVSIAPLEDVGDALFPWFEPANLVETAQRMLELMHMPPIREGLRAAGLDYVAFLETERSSERNPQAVRCDTTYRAPGCSGVRADPLKTKIRVTLWNLRRYTMSARFETESAGSATFAGLTVPLAGDRASPASACERAADAVGRLIGGR